MSEQNAGYQVHLEMYDGPFELLLYLIEKEQMDIFDIPVAQITQQFIEQLARMRDLNMEVTSNFLVMASTLLAIKARLLLPSVTADEEEMAEIEASKQLLIDNILYYKAFKELSATLEDLSEQQRRFCVRPPADELYMQFFAEKNPLDGKSLEDLLAAYQAALARLEQQPPQLTVRPRLITIDSKVQALRSLVRRSPEGFMFSTLFNTCASKNEMVVTFLALLELIKGGALRVMQKSYHDDIYICGQEAV